MLADHVDLMQGLFSGVLALRESETKMAASVVESRSSSTHRKGHSWTSVAARVVLGVILLVGVCSRAHRAGAPRARARPHPARWRRSC